MNNEPVLLIMRGLPASGKTTSARMWVEEHPDYRARISRDDIRTIMFGAEGILPYAQEEMVTLIQRAAADALLLVGKSVVIDDMNLRDHYVEDWVHFAHEHGAVAGTYTIEVPLEECVKRDRLRGEVGGRTLGEEVIRSIAARYPFPLTEIDLV